MADEVGFVKSVRGPVVYVEGLPEVAVGELVETKDGARGFVGSLRADLAEIFLLTETDVEPGQMFSRTGESLDMPVGDFLVGRVINPLGEPLDEGSAFAKASAGEGRLALDQPAVGISGRRFITEQFDTGIGVIDTILPIGKGQRELVIGEQRSGKSQFLIDIIANLVGQGVICIYALIGKPIAETRDVWRELLEFKLLSHTVLLVSTAADPAPLTFLTAQSAMTIAQYFQRKGKDVLVVLDDMGVQARNYREMALVSGRPPGRESYPGDIFYQQARLLERAGCFNPSAGSGSITALPVMELILAEYAGFIPTNLMGMTDGHLLFKSALSQQGKRPAIDLFLSVTRVGSQTQERLQNALAMRLKETLTRGAQLELVSRFGSELPAETKQSLLQKQQVEELLNQKVLEKISKEAQMILYTLPFTTLFKGKDVSFVRLAKEKLMTAFKTDEDLKKLLAEVWQKKDLSELVAAIEAVKPKLETYATNQTN